MYVCTKCMWKPDVDTECLHLTLSTLFFEARSLTKCGAHQLGKNSWPEGSKDPTSAFPHPGLQVHNKSLATCRGTEDLNTDPHVCRASTWYTKSSSHPSRLHLFPDKHYRQFLDEIHTTKF